MNAINRSELKIAIEYLEQAKSIIESIRDDEQEKFDNLNEGLQATERGQKLEENSSTLEEIVSSIDDSIEQINEM